MADQALGLGIFEDRFRNVSAENDTPIEYTHKVEIVFSDYDKYLIVNSIDEELINSIIEEFREIFQIEKIDFTIKKSKSLSILNVNIDEFIDYMYLVQHFNCNKSTDQEEFITGILVNRFDISRSFYVVNESSGKHINSLIGEDYLKKPFSIFLLDNFDQETFLGYNENLKFNEALNLQSVIEHIKEIDFK